MSVSTEQLEAFVSDIGDISYQDNAKVLATKSKDYFWYSPILKEQLDDCVGQLLVLPKTEEEIITVATAPPDRSAPRVSQGRAAVSSWRRHRQLWPMRPNRGRRDP